MENIGFFRGTTLMQTSGNIGGARSVFVKLKGIKNDLVYPTFGGMLMNPPKGNGFKFYAGDLFYFDFDEKGHNPVLYLLKTYKVLSVSGSVVNIVKSEYSHKPFVGDKLGVAPSEIGGKMTAATITKVEVTKVGNQEVWACTMSSALSAVKNDVLVEAGDDDTMLVKKITGVADCDGDIYYAGTTDENDFEKARYFYTPALGGIMYESKMSPLPQCVKAVNQSKFNGWFAVQPIYK